MNERPNGWYYSQYKDWKPGNGKPTRSYMAIKLGSSYYFKTTILKVANFKLEIANFALAGIYECLAHISLIFRVLWFSWKITQAGVSEGSGSNKKEISGILSYLYLKSPLLLLHELVEAILPARSIFAKKSFMYSSSLPFTKRIFPFEREELFVRKLASLPWDYFAFFVAYESFDWPQCDNFR